LDMEEKSRKQGRVEARFEGGKGPEGAVAPYMDGSTPTAAIITHCAADCQSFLWLTIHKYREALPPMHDTYRTQEEKSLASLSHFRLNS
jgi:hypothetical protein